jgi:hypothetical protein
MNRYDADKIGSKNRLSGFGRARSRTRARIRSRFVQTPDILHVQAIMSDWASHRVNAMHIHQHNKRTKQELGGYYLLLALR